MRELRAVASIGVCNPELARGDVDDAPTVGRPARFPRVHVLRWEQSRCASGGGDQIRLARATIRGNVGGAQRIQYRSAVGGDLRVGNRAHRREIVVREGVLLLGAGNGRGAEQK